MNLMEKIFVGVSSIFLVIGYCVFLGLCHLWVFYKERALEENNKKLED